MNSHSDIKLTDQLERELIEQEVARQDLGIARDLRSAVAAVQSLFSTLQAQARRAKVAFANG
jgi:hypothetical protein